MMMRRKCFAETFVSREEVSSKRVLCERVAVVTIWQIG